MTNEAVPGTFPTIQIYGNIISGPTGIYLTSDYTFVDIRNNFIKTTGIGINIYNAPASFAQVNTIYNNTFQLQGVSPLAAFYLSAATGNTSYEFMNNLVDIDGTATGAYGLYSNNAFQVNAYYNVFDAAITSTNRVAGYITNQANNSGANVTLNANGTVQGSAGVNAGNPSPLYYDLDLTVNDAGAYGGSYTLTNYSQMLTGAGRVYMVNVAPTVRTGNTLNVTAESYDR